MLTVASSTTAVVNIRMGSARLPGKALRVICGKPLMRHVIDRLALAATVDQVIVATSTLPVNDAIASYCAEQGISCFRGSEGDVLMRTLNALQHAGAMQLPQRSRNRARLILGEFLHQFIQRTPLRTMMEYFADHWRP